MKLIFDAIGYLNGKDLAIFVKDNSTLLTTVYPQLALNKIISYSTDDQCLNFPQMQLDMFWPP